MPSGIARTRLGEILSLIHIFFCLMKPFFCRNTLRIARKNGAQQVEKTRCLGVLTVFR